MSFSRSARSARVTGVALIGVLALLTAGCSDDATPKSTSTPQSSASTSGSSTPSETGSTGATPTTSATSATPSPTSVETTEPGTSLAFGETATVSWSPTQTLAGLLQLTVKSAQKGRLRDFSGFNLQDSYRKHANYYYVRVAVKNVGTSNLGGRVVPLNGVNQANTLLPPVIFESQFKPCPFQKLPDSFGPGAAMSTCLVFLSPNKGQLSAVSYRPDDSVEGITWQGTVAAPTPVKKNG